MSATTPNPAGLWNNSRKSKAKHKELRGFTITFLSRPLYINLIIAKTPVLFCHTMPYPSCQARS